MTIMEIVYPLYWLLILVMLQSTLPVDTAIPEIDGFSSVPLLPFTTKCVTSGDSLLRVCQIAYAPDDSEVVRSTMVCNLVYFFICDVNNIDIEETWRYCTSYSFCK